MNWRPIETAPKVWASLLLAKSTYDGHFIEPVIGGWDDGAWRNRNGDHLEGQVVNITHWMPLPPPPPTEPAPQDTGEKWEVVNEYGEHNLYRGNEYVGEVRFEEQGQEICASMNLLAGHDLSQVVVVDKAVVEKVKVYLANIRSMLAKQFGEEVTAGSDPDKLLASLNAGGADE